MHGLPRRGYASAGMELLTPFGSSACARRVSGTVASGRRAGATGGGITETSRNAAVALARLEHRTEGEGSVGGMGGAWQDSSSGEWQSTMAL